MSTVEQNKQAVRRFLAMINTGSTEEVEEFLDPSWISHNPPLPSLQGLDGACMLVRQIRSGFPDARVTIDDITGEGDRIAVRFSFAGTHNGRMLGIPATGRGVTVTCLAIFRVAGGRIADDWLVFDGLGLLQQLGAMPITGLGRWQWPTAA